MRLFAVLGLSACLIAASSTIPAAAAGHRIARILRDNVQLRRAPSSTSQALAVLYDQNQVTIMGKKGTWDRVCVWSGLVGWVPAVDITFRPAWNTPSTYRAPVVHQQIHAHPSSPLNVLARATKAVTLSRHPGGMVLRRLPNGSAVRVTSWQQDRRGTIWYRVGEGWVPGATIQFNIEKSEYTRTGRPIASAIHGKGMWLTLGTIATAAPSAIVQAARRDGITHLYLESAISPLGFHGRDVVGPLLDAAHAAHISVLAWVYPYLYDVGSDVDLTRAVAHFTTARGNRFDGIAVDIERNMRLDTIRAYSQLIRAELGPHQLLVAVTYPPQSLPTFPFGQIARSYDVIAPMDYWHQTKTSQGLNYAGLHYGYRYAYRYAVESVSAIRREAGRTPVAPIGQTFDDFGRLGMGSHEPSASEIRGFLAGVRSTGASSASFFQWMTATAPEWQVIHKSRV